MTKYDMLFLLDRFQSKVEKLTQTKSANSHPYFQWRYWMRLNGPSCPHLEPISKIVDFKDFEPELKELTDGYLRFRFEHESEFSQPKQ